MPRIRSDHDETSTPDPCTGIQYDVHPNQITAWKAQVMEGVAGILGSGNAGIEAAPAVDVKVLHAKIGELTL
jgi:transposase